MSQDTKAGSFGLSSQVQIGIAIALVAALGALLISKYVGADSEPVVPAGPSIAGPVAYGPGSETAARAVLQAEVRPAVLPQPPRVLFITRDPFAPTDKLRRVLSTGSSPLSLPLSAGQGPTKASVRAALRQASGLRLKGTAGQGASRVAFINEKVVRTGGTVEGFSVLEIHDREVVLRKDDKRIVLTLAEPGSPASSPSSPRFVPPPDSD